VKVTDPWYDWAKLMDDPSDSNPHHCLLKFTEPTHVDLIVCTDGNWLPSPYMLRAAAKAICDSAELDRHSVSGITLSVWDALDYLLDDFRFLRLHQYARSL